MLFTCPSRVCDIFTYYRGRYQVNISHSPEGQVNNLNEHLQMIQNGENTEN